MAGTTTNYAWTYPTSTDLVKDGATAIQTAIQGADTSLFSITSGKNVGLVHIATTSFTSASTVNVNNCFTSAFKNYHILIKSEYGGTDPVDLRLKLRVGGVDNSSAVYSTSSFLVDPGGTANTGEAASGNGWKFESTNKMFGASLDIFRPQETIVTTANGTNSHLYQSSPRVVMTGFVHNAATSFDGFSLLWGTAITGSVQIFGYRNS
jgi:hypothetical protein